MLGPNTLPPAQEASPLSAAQVASSSPVPVGQSPAGMPPPPTLFKRLLPWACSQGPSDFLSRPFSQTPLSCQSRYSHGLPVHPPCPSESWALPALGLRLVWGLPPAVLWLLLHLFLSSLRPMSHLLPLKTKLQVRLDPVPFLGVCVAFLGCSPSGNSNFLSLPRGDPIISTEAATWPAGRRTGWKRQKSPQATIALDKALLPDGHLVSHLSPMPHASFLVWGESLVFLGH